MSVVEKQKVLVITGGSSGIGEATIKHFVEKNVKVYNLDIKSPRFIHPLASFIPCDVSKFSDVAAAFKIVKDEAVNKEQVVDYVIANAGIYVLANLEDTTEEALDQVISVNLKGSYYTLQQAIPIMKMQRYGSIVLMGSDQSLIGKLECSIYGATKGALAQLTKSTALDYAAYNIRVNCVCPSAVDTPLYHEILKAFSEKRNTDKALIHQALSQEIPLKRIGKASEIA